MDGEGAPPIRREVRLRDGTGCGMGALAAALEPALVEAAGPGASCVSVSLEFSDPPGEESLLQVEAWVERATRTLVFAAARAHADGKAVASASAIFSRAGGRPLPATLRPPRGANRNRPGCSCASTRPAPHPRRRRVRSEALPPCSSRPRPRPTR